MNRLLLGFCLLSLASCDPEADQNPPPDDDAPITVFEGARVIPGDGSPAQENSIFIVQEGRIQRVGTADEIGIPPGATRIDLTGKTVMPLITTLHTHLGYAKGTSFTEDNYSADTIDEQLETFLYYGVANVLSLGVDIDETPFEIRDAQRNGSFSGARIHTAGRGLAAPSAGPQFPAMRDVPRFIETEADARAQVRELADSKVDIIKIWVDDRNDTVDKLTPEIYRTVIEEAHAHGLRVFAHVYELGDAKELARAGVDGFAHLVRDLEVDQELVDLVVENDIVIISNLNVQGHPDKDASLDDPALHETVSAKAIAELRAGSGARRGDPERSLAIYRNMEASLRKLSEAGARIGFGGDSGIPRNFVGFSEHRELQLMVEAGMTPLDAIRAATSTSAQILGLDEVGSLVRGKRADFMVLDGNPLNDISHSRDISEVYRNGQKIDRAALIR